MAHDTRTRQVPAELATRVRSVVREQGAAHAARALGVSRSVVLAVAAGEGVMPGSIALLERAVAARPSELAGPVPGFGGEVQS